MQRIVLSLIIKELAGDCRHVRSWVTSLGSDSRLSTCGLGKNLPAGQAGTHDGSEVVALIVI
jgi:hypothetical protein